MPHATEELLVDLAERQHGLVARFQTKELGVSRQTVSEHLKGPGWQARTGQVLARTGSPPTPAQRALTAVLDAGVGAVLSHFSAGAFWGLKGCSIEPHHVTRTSRSSRTSAIAVIHTVRVLPPEWTTMLDGVPIVRPELLALQLYQLCRDERAERLVDSLWSMRLLSGRSLRAFLDALGRRGRNGTAGLRSYLDERGDDHTPPASGLEGRLMQLLREEGIEMRRQVDSGGDRWTGRVDFRHATLPLIVEVQSERYHSALSDQRADRQRISDLEADGFVVVEVSDADVWTRPRVAMEAVRRGIEEARSR